MIRIHELLAGMSSAAKSPDCLLANLPEEICSEIRALGGCYRQGQALKVRKLVHVFRKLPAHPEDCRIHGNLSNSPLP
jgi:hypothetical protein